MIKKMMLVAITAICALFTCTLKAQLSPADVVKATESFDNIKEFKGILQHYDSSAVVIEDNHKLKFVDLKATVDFMVAVNSMRKNPDINGFIALLKAASSSKFVATAMGAESENDFKEMKQILAMLQSAPKEQLDQFEKQILANKEQMLKELPDVNEFIESQEENYKTLKVLSEKIEGNTATVITEYSEHVFDEESEEFIAIAKTKTLTKLKKINDSWKIVRQVKEQTNK